MTTLSNDLKVACEIWHYNQRSEPIHTGKLMSSLAWCMQKRDVWHALDTLTDWGVIYGAYGPTEAGRAGYCFYIDGCCVDTVKELYERHWKDVRQ